MFAVDGMWSEWAPWSPCKHPFSQRNIRCQQMGGSQSRDRQCLHRAHNGSICNGSALTETQVCYDVSQCSGERHANTHTFTFSSLQSKCILVSTSSVSRSPASELAHRARRNLAISTCVLCPWRICFTQTGSSFWSSLVTLLLDG